MESRFNEIEELLTKFATNGITDKKHIYYELCVYGLSDEERESRDLLVEDQDKLLYSYAHKPFSVIRKG